MRRALCRAKFKVRFETVVDRPPAAGEIRVRITHCGVCGSDVHDASTRFKQWQPMGHEMTGVVEWDPLGKLKVGSPVAIKNAAACGACEACLAGVSRYCTAPIHCVGGFTTHLRVDRRLAVPLKGLTPVQGVLVEPLNVALDMIETAGIGPDDPVVIVGPGPIGIMAAHICRHRFHSRVWVLGRRTDRARLEALAGVEPSAVMDTARSEWRQQAAIQFKPLRNLKFLVTIPPGIIAELAGSIAPAQSVFTTIGLSHSDHEERLTCSIRNWMFRRYQLRTSFAYPNLYFEEAIDLIHRRVIDPERLVSHYFTLDRLSDALRAASAHGPGFVKAVVTCDA